ncbi:MULTISPECIES: hypothetical protein [unclassified Streptomyces]|uniref:hypothetical protein n=1 Tax=unclassified Streptomyces TaxID=2593676 RepID=UPI000D0E4E2D|nr:MULTISPECIES: hypothetical protein [unclassified Streptomyces]MYT33089.1 hypothetical protein [Streptomyces sp. SID8354]
MRNSATKAARSAVVVALAVTAMGTTTAAHAATTPSTGSPTLYAAGCPGDGRPGGGNACTSLSSGAVFHSKILGANVRIETSYKKVSGGKITGQLGYSNRGTNHWGSTFTQSAGTTKTSTWTSYDSSFRCAPTVGMLKVNGQSTFQTPVASC